MARFGVRRNGNRWVARPYVAGRGHIYVKGSFDTEAEATKAALELIDQERLLPAHKETVASFAARWVKDFPRPKESTNDRYHADAQRFAKEHGAKKLHEVAVPEARTYARRRPHDHAALRAMYSDARAEGLVRDNPFSNLRISKGRGRKDIVPVTPEELDQLAAIALDAHGTDKRGYGPTFRAFLIFAANSGLRSGEVCGLDWSDIDFEAEEIRIERQFHKRRITLPKNGRTRKAFLSPPAAAALRSIRHPGFEGKTGDPVFVGKLGQRITANALSGYWTPVRIAFEATLEPERLSEFKRAEGSLDFYAVTRHYCATSLVEQGVESWIIARQLGHEDGGRLVESTYGHPRDEVARERLRRAFKQNVKPLQAVDDAEAANG